MPASFHTSPEETSAEDTKHMPHLTVRAFSNVDNLTIFGGQEMLLLSPNSAPVNYDRVYGSKAVKIHGGSFIVGEAEPVVAVLSQLGAPKTHRNHGPIAEGVSLSTNILFG